LFLTGLNYFNNHKTKNVPEKIVSYLVTLDPPQRFQKHSGNMLQSEISSNFTSIKMLSLLSLDRQVFQKQ